MTQVSLEKASSKTLESTLELVERYHAFEGITQAPDDRRKAVAQLLENPALGEIYLIFFENRLSGYIALCFGYSIEFAGRDAFIDEFFLTEDARGRGIGGLVLDQVFARLSEAGIAALHLEVDNENHSAQRFYRRHGFEARRKYHLMSRSLM